MDYKPKYWRVLFVMLSLAYLLPEAIFNAQLVSLIGHGSPSKDKLEQLEIFGRAISGLGVTLLLCDLLPAYFFKGLLRGLLSISVVGLIVWPTVYFGQKMLVERLIIEPSSPTDRQDALMSAALRDAVALNAVKVKDLSYDFENFDTPENLTFLALFGGLLFADKDLADSLGDDKKAIIIRLFKKQAYKDIDEHYENFSQIYDSLSKSYSEYAKESNRYYQIIADIPNREQDYWNNVEQEVNSGWQKYQKAQLAHIARAEARAQEFGPKIYSYHESVQKCAKRYDEISERDSKERCIEKHHVAYKKEIERSGLGYIKPSYWLIVEDVSFLDKATKTIIPAILTGGLSLAVQAIDYGVGGDGMLPNKTYRYTKDPKHYQNLIRQHPNFEAIFKKENGYPSYIEALSNFRQHESTQNYLRAYMSKKGLSLPENWSINDRDDFYFAVEEKVKKQATVKWNQELQKIGLKLPQGLTWADFQKHQSIQDNIKQRIGELYVPNIRVDWNKANFKRFVLDPNIKKRAKRYLPMIDGAEPYFSDGKKYAEDGKQSLRTVIVPTISMTLSLFLICLTLVKLPIKTLEIVKPDWQKILPFGFSFVFRVIPIALLIMLPLKLVSNTFTSQAKSPVNYFLEKIDRTSHPVFSFALRWTLHAQPLLYPMGMKFEDTTAIYSSAKPLTEVLAKMYYEEKMKRKAKRKRGNTGDYLNHYTKLTVNTNVPFANVRIMNIKPKYIPNMTLKTGNYDIEVSAPGYKKYRRWHFIEPGNQDIKIKLVRL